MSAHRPRSAGRHTRTDGRDHSNDGALETSGVDIQFNWVTDIGPGTLDVNAQANVLDSMKTRVSPTAPWTEWVGSSGPNDLTGVQGGSYDYRTFNDAVVLREPGLEREPALAPSPEPGVGGDGVDPTNTTQPTDAYNVFDLYGSYGFGGVDNYLLRFGVDNLLDTDPEITGRTLGDDPSSGRGSTDEGFYDVLGRRYFVGFTMQF